MTRLVISLLCVAVCSLSGFAAAEGSASRVELDDLLGAFSKMSGLEARFVEEKKMQILAVPLRSEGRLYFAPPGYLLRRIERPQPSKVLITPNELLVDDGVRKEVIDLGARRDVRSFVSSFVSLLAGDKAALEAAYAITLEPLPARRWQMALRPKSPPLSTIIREVRVTGEGLAVDEIRVFDTNGDQTTTRMLEVNPARRFNASERKALFGIED